MAMLCSSLLFKVPPAALRPVGDFVWWQTEPNGVLSENCMFTTVDAGLGFWDVACDETYYPVCQRMM